MKFTKVKIKGVFNLSNIFSSDEPLFSLGNNFREFCELAKINA